MLGFFKCSCSISLLDKLLNVCMSNDTILNNKQNNLTRIFSICFKKIKFKYDNNIIYIILLHRDLSRVHPNLLFTLKILSGYPIVG